jgi:hypothetical protein
MNFDQVLPKFQSMQKILNERDHQIAELKSWKIKALQRIHLLEEQLRNLQVNPDEGALHVDWMVMELCMQIIKIIFPGAF